MAKLVLDLDLTTFIAELDTGPTPEKEMIHSSHTLKEIASKATLAHKQISATLHIINPDELSEIIEYACTKGGGLIILTSGLWDPDIRGILADSLNLSDHARKTLRTCYFHSALTDAELLKMSVREAMLVPKDQRLKKIIDFYPELKGQYFVSLDDNVEHFNAYKTMNNVLPVLATPQLEDKCYYEQTIKLFNSAKIQERTIYPKNNYNGKINVTFFSNENKRKRCDDNNYTGQSYLTEVKSRRICDNTSIAPFYMVKK